jgi:hypothetical protein
MHLLEIVLDPGPVAKLGLVGDPFTVRGLVETALHF